MGLLSQDYYQELLKTSAPSAPVSAPPTVPSVAPSPEPGSITRFGPDVSPDIQALRAKSRAEHPTATGLSRGVYEMLGIHLPEPEIFDKMTRTEQVGRIAGELTALPVRLALGIPKVIAAALPSFAANIYPIVKGGFTGKLPSQEELEKRELKLPIVGQVPNYFGEGRKAYDNARAFGFGPVASSLFYGVTAGSYALGDLAIFASLVEAIAAAASPRKALKEGETIKNIEPIRQVPPDGGGGGAAGALILKKSGSHSEYYSVPKTFAATQAERFAGTGFLKAPGNVFFKVTPAGEGAVELSLVQRVPGPIQAGVEYVKNKLGIPTRIYRGDFGPEIKFSSQVVPVSANISEALGLTKKVPIAGDIQQAAASTLDRLMQSQAGERLFLEAEVGGGSRVVGAKTTFPDWVPEDLRSSKLFASTAEKLTTEGEIKFTPREQKVVDVMREQIAKETGRPVSEIPVEAFTQEFQTIKLRRRDEAQLLPLSEKPLKGRENAPITLEQLENLDRIGRVIGQDPEMTRAVVKIVTGKDAAGALTQAEYLQAAKAFSLFRDVFDPGFPILNIRRYVSPQRHWMRTQEEKSGVPLYSEVYVPMEDAARATKVFVDAAENRLDQIFGKYGGAKYAEERRLLKSYLEGDEGAILGNATLDAATKNDLVGIGQALRDFYNEFGPKVDVPVEAFLKGEYQPHISDLGGIFQLYKKGSELGIGEFFAKQKRVGSLSTQVDDARALASIYVRAGAKRVFYKPVVERIKGFIDGMPAALQDSTKSYIFEKLGYAGEMERALDNLALDLNRKMGWNLPPDIARQITNQALNTVYSGALGLNPASAFRNLLQYPFVGYPRLGPKFMAEAMQKAFTKEGIGRVRDAGFLVDLGVPYGEELAKSANVTGRVSNAYRATTQATLIPYERADVLNRTATWWQTRFQWEDALARYNRGEITWKQLEGKSYLDFGALHPVDAKIIRQRLINGDLEGGFNQYVRDVLDDTQFPYRRGASGRVTYGLAGKLGTTFLQWPLEFSHTLATWVGRRQWDKLMRFYAVSSVLRRGLQQQFGFDFQNDLYLGPINPSLSPAARSAYELVGAMDALWQGNDQALDDHKDALYRQLSLGVPAGLEGKRVLSFRKSYEAGAIGPGGTYPVYSSTGRLLYYASFRDIFWQMLGFPTNEKVRQAQLREDLRRAKFNTTLAKENVLKLWQREKYDEATKIIEQFNLTFSGETLENELRKHYIPVTEQLYQNLPMGVKPYFTDRVFPSQ